MFFVTHPHAVARVLRQFDHRTERDAAREPALDLSEDDKAYTVNLDMPGVSKAAVKVRIDGRKVHVETQATEAGDAAAAEGARVVYRERRPSRYARSFQLPQEIDQSASEARFENGVLTLTLAKRQTIDSGTLTIN
jgi:HSP20 family protein